MTAKGLKNRRDLKFNISTRLALQNELEPVTEFVTLQLLVDSE